MEKTYTLREMFAALYRRRWLALGIGAAVLVASTATIFALPNEYRSESVTQIEPHQLPHDFFPASVTSFEDRMRTLKHGLLARPILERVLQQTDFYPKWKADPDEAIEKLRRNVEVRLEGELAGGPPSLLFVVDVRGPDRNKVAQAAEIIPQTYAEMTRQVMQTQANNVRVTLTKQLDDMSTRLGAEEEKLIAFKSKYATEVPEAAEANLRAAGGLTAQLDAHLAALGDAQRRRSAVLATIPEVNSAPGLTIGNAEDVLRRLEAARAAYGNDHPDVKRLERQYRDATSRNETEQGRFQKDRLQAQLARIDAEVKDHQAAMKDLQGQLAGYQKRVDQAPHRGEQYRVLSRDYETLRAKYTTTLARVSDAQAAESLLAADASTLFRMVQPAVAASKPAGPNRLNLFLVALAASLGASLLAAAAAEYFDTSLRGAQDATDFGVPVLATIPRIGLRRVGGQG